MVYLYDFKSRGLADIPEASVTEAIASGRYGFRKGDRIPAISPSGDPVTLPSESVHRAFGDGFVYEGEEATRSRKIRDEARASPGEAFLWAAGDSALLGIPSLVATSGPGSAQAKAELRALREENPIASTLGDIAGVVVPVTPGGALVGFAGRGLARVGARVTAKVGISAAETLGAKVLHGVASTALRGAGEEAVFGAIRLVSETAIGRAELNAESVLAYVGGNALLGAGGGAVFGLAATVAKAGAAGVARRIGGTRVRDWLSGFADDRALRVVTGKQVAAVDKLELKGIKEKAQKYIQDEIGLKLGDSTESMAPKLAARQAELGDELGAIINRLDEATVGAPASRIAPEQVARRIETELLSTYKGVAASERVEALVAKEIDNIRVRAGDMPISYSEARIQRSAMQDSVNWDLEGKVGAKARKAMSRIWNDAIDDAAAPVFKQLGEDPSVYRAVRHEYAMVLDLVKYNSKRIRGNENLNVFSVGDVAIGAATGVTVGGPGGLIAGLAGASARKTLRKYGDAAVSIAARKLANLNILSKAAQATSKRVDDSVAQMLARKKWTGRAAIASMRLVYTPLRPGSDAGKTTSEAVKLRAEEIANLMASPDDLADRIAAALISLEDAAPMTAASLGTKAVQIAQFLQSKIPRDPLVGIGLQPQMDDWLPSPSEASRFARYYAAAMDPLSVVDEIAAGTVTREAVETLRALYPEIFEMVKARLAAGAAELSTRIPYAERIMLSGLFGIPLDPTMRPASIARSQALYQPKPVPPPPAPGRGQAGRGNRLTGLAKIKKVTSMGRTESQKLEESETS